MSDRLSALVLMVQASPLHNTRALTSLLSIAQKKSREESLKALRAIVDWWEAGGAPDRKLKYFRDQPLTHPSVTDVHRVLWFMEDWLKKYFWDVLTILETLTADPLPYVRIRSTALIAALLKAKPEQEHNLLRLLVNKLGDLHKPLASKASYHLLQILQHHPNMKLIVINEVSSLLLRAPTSTSAALPKNATNGKPHENGKAADANEHARYYATITFNQITLSHSKVEKSVASALVGLYFELFKSILGSTEADIPIGTDEPTEEKVKGREEMRKDKKRRQSREGKTKKSDASNVFGEIESGQEKLLGAILTGLHRALPYAEIDGPLIEKHMDILFRLCHTSTFNISVQALLLVHTVCVAIRKPVSSTKPSAAAQNFITRYYRVLYSSLFDPRLATSSKQGLYLNLLLRSMKEDELVDRVKAFIRRLIGVILTAGIAGEISFVCGCLYLLGEITSTTPGLRKWISSRKNEPSTFDPKKREPEFAGAGEGCVWELSPLLYHYHPSVSLHANQLLTQTTVTANADLGLNTLSHFLDRFVYRNPKKPKPRGESAMQPAASSSGAGLIINTEAVQGTVVRDEQFRKMRADRVPADQLFFHKYFSQKHERTLEREAKLNKRKKKAGGDDDDDDEDEEEEEDAASAVQEDKPTQAEDSEEDAEVEEDKEEEAIWKVCLQYITAIFACSLYRIRL
ncbi:CBF-domain-containing protein [Sistotremastrum suecicum HHB10207 ss-3]|uniref:CBF-domain-containing protein n=1 Tax=Sistotremastrum suecicum HHB10207 ss-3 TaxID=1314776 RepID=A0A166DU07_9AGAM|nr:CBF-domain-containing protein [Sistotremastrum suecicum HHB10207 ss-3]